MAQQTASTVISESVTDANLDPFPLKPEQILDGDPQASAKLIWTSADGTQASGIWECTPGTFNYEHTNETAGVIAGKATITPEGGEPVEVGPGSIVFFAEGSKTHWVVEETIRKSFHLQADGGLGL